MWAGCQGTGIAARLKLAGKHDDMRVRHSNCDGPWAVKKFEFDADKFLHELVDTSSATTTGADRMLVQTSRSSTVFALGDVRQPHPKGTFQLTRSRAASRHVLYFKS